ncbi:MAG TPA: hypothetical protein PLB90_11950 [Opitutaceae bacterium]|nr:hypothetical protein [Opitutaceae bacterium]
MSGPRPSHLLCLAVWAVAVRASDPPPKPVAPSSPDGISAAKREFDTLKGPRNLTESQKIDLPITTPPVLNAGNDEMTQLLNAQAEQRKQGANKKNRGQRGTNWLVDAMTQKSDAKDGKDHAGTTTADKLLAGNETESNDTPLAATTALAAADTTSRESNRPEPRHTDPRDNPLNTYMSGWMTSKDYELLNVKPSADGLPAVAVPSGGSTSSVDNLVRTGGPGPAYQVQGRSAVSDSTANPYLGGLGDSGGGLAAAAREFANVPPPVSSAVAPVAPASAPPPEMVPPPTRNEPPINDVLKPNNDTKYFRQLKRF